MTDVLNSLTPWHEALLLIVLVAMILLLHWAWSLPGRRRKRGRAALRDKFAAHAMAALIVNDHSPERDGFEAVTITDICTDAYRYADQMMIERKVDSEFKDMVGVAGIEFGKRVKGTSATNGRHPLCTYPSCACGIGCQHKEVRHD